MKRSSIAISALGILLAFGCTTSPQQEYGQLESTKDETKLNISFSAEGADYERTVSEVNHTAIGWIENGTWRASSDVGVAEVNVYIATLYDGRAFKKEHVQDMRKLVRGFSSLGAPDFGEQGEVTTNSGPIEYVFFRRSNKACVFIRKYWSDPELAGDINQLHATLGWVAGSSVIYASDCRPGGKDLQLNDLNRLFNGITAKNLYWPGSMFVSSDRTLGGGTVGFGEGTGSDLDITGRYVSEITNNNQSYFKKKYRNLVITLNQDGNNITGTDESGSAIIEGNRNGDTIKFVFFYDKVSSFEVKGTWNVIADGTMVGSWIIPGNTKNPSGNWSLTRIE